MGITTEAWLFNEHIGVFGRLYSVHFTLCTHIVAGLYVLVIGFSEKVPLLAYDLPVTG